MRWAWALISGLLVWIPGLGYGLGIWFWVSFLGWDINIFICISGESIRVLIGGFGFWVKVGWFVKLSSGYF